MKMSFDFDKLRLFGGQTGVLVVAGALVEVVVSGESERAV